MDGWMDGRMDGWMDLRSSRVMARQVKGLRESWARHENEANFRAETRTIEEMECWTAGGRGGPGDCAPFGDR